MEEFFIFLIYICIVQKIYNQICTLVENAGMAQSEIGL